MNQTEAFAQLYKLLGKDFRYQVRKDALTGDEREAAVARLGQAIAASKSATEALLARRQALLDGDAEYQRLLIECNHAEQAKRSASSDAHLRRISVGTVSGVAGLNFFHVEAVGDNWQEVVDEVKKRKQERRA